MIELSKAPSELLSEALGLNTDYLENIECMKTETLVCHHYPACLEPDLTLDTTKHSNPASLTILLQDSIGGLQVLHHTKKKKVQFLILGCRQNCYCISQSPIYNSSTLSVVLLLNHETKPT